MNEYEHVIFLNRYGNRSALTYQHRNILNDNKEKLITVDLILILI
jgi:hypothetical protein